ncbi:hypothetical protein [Pseudomonas sp. PLMAX]|jgi:hypothetical protein|uniref:hypothetical protein n=1 Tax=Pseudomonas sp. PLMAX TaxID=2201998 RepID=UPI0038B8F96E
MNIPDIKGAPARVLAEARNLSETKCIKIIIALDLVFGWLFLYLGAEALICIQSWLRWSGLAIQLVGLVLALRGWSLLSRYRHGMTGVEPWWSFERAVDRVR